MTTSIEGLSLEELIDRRNIFLRHVSEIDEEILKRRDILLDKGSSILDSVNETSKKEVKKKKITVKKKESDKKKDTTKRKIKATSDDMKNVLNKNNIKFKSTILRDELENLIRQNNLVRVSEKISQERKSSNKK